MKKFISSLLAIFMVTTSICVAQQTQDQVVLNGTNIRLRLEPNLKCGWLKYDNGAPIYLKKGTTLPYAGEEGDFYAVQYNGSTVYVAKQFSYLKSKGKPVNTTTPTKSTVNTSASTTTTQQTAPSNTTVTLTGTNVRLRLGPGTNYDFLKNDDGSPCYLPKGTKLTKKGEQGDFYKCTYKGRIVYVSKQFAK